MPIVARSLPSTRNADSTSNGIANRGGVYGEQYSVQLARDYAFADEGSLFVAVNPTAGTGILGHAAPTTFDETKPYLFVYNGGLNYIYPQSLRLHDTVVSVGGTRIQFNQTIDTGKVYTSGGTALTKSNTNMSSSNTGSALVYAGAVVVPAATGSRRLLGNTIIRGGVIDVVHDTYEFTWGNVAPSVPVAVNAESTTTIRANYSLPAVVIGPGQCLALYQWAGSQSTGPTFEVQFTYVER